MIRSPRRRAAVALVLAAALSGGAAPATGRQPRAVAVGRIPVEGTGEAGGAARGDAAVRPGEVLVKAARNRGLHRALAKIDGHAARSLGRGVSVVAVRPGSEHRAAQALANDPDVAFAEPNYIRTAASHTSDEVGWGVRRVRAPVLWHAARPTNGDGVRVAVIDSGVNKNHDQLTGRVAPGFDPYRTAGRDECGHGTAVAGVIAAAADGRSTVGVAPGATIVPVKVLRLDPFLGCAGDDAEIIAGLQWAADPSPQGGRADIINMSLSGPQHSALLRDAIDYATSQGVLVVAAAGNTGDREIQYPAAYPDVMSVGGIQRSATSVRWWPNTSFANVDVAAAAKAVPVITARTADPSLVARRCSGRPGWCADGTSFAAPHVAGVAALLAERHDLRNDPAPSRLRRLNQWILGTAPRVPRRSGGVDLKTGHGAADAVAARDASLDPGRVLLTWKTTPRIIAPTKRMAASAHAVKATLVATTGTGAALAGRPVRFIPPRQGSVTTTRTATSSSGRVGTTFRSTAAGTTTRLVAAVGTRKVPFDTYVLQRDDNTPGVRLPRGPFANSLNVALDVDDVFRVFLRAKETLRARVTNVTRGREYVDMFLHRPGTRDVTNPFLAPLQEPAPYDEDPRVLRRKVHSDGVRYLDVYGYGTYRLQWSIYAPDKVRRLTVRPATITPDGDGRQDRAKVSWRLRTRGNVVVRVRNSAGRTVRTVNLGREPAGARTWRWSGRSNAGTKVRAGTYRVLVGWSNGAGRVSAAATRVTVRR